MSIWSAAIDVAFNDPNIGEPASWLPGGTGTAIPCIVIRKRPDVEAAVQGGLYTLPAVLVDVRLSDVPNPQMGDVVVFPDGSRVLIGASSKIDSLRIVRTMEASDE